MKKAYENFLIFVFISVCACLTFLALNGIFSETTVVGLAIRLWMLAIVVMFCLFVFWAALPNRRRPKKVSRNDQS